MSTVAPFGLGQGRDEHRREPNRFGVAPSKPRYAVIKPCLEPGSGKGGRFDSEVADSSESPTFRISHVLLGEGEHRLATDRVPLRADLGAR